MHEAIGYNVRMPRSPLAAFHVESLNQNDVLQTATPPPGHYGSAAPSRPPSRTNSKNALDRMVDWTAGDAGMSKYGSKANWAGINALQ